MKRVLRSLHLGFACLAALVLSTGAARAVDSFLIVDNQTGYVLASKESDQKRQIASLTKIATALVVLDWAKLTNADLGELVAVPDAAMSAGGINIQTVRASTTSAARLRSFRSPRKTATVPSAAAPRNPPLE